jgi:hypothetical protein
MVIFQLQQLPAELQLEVISYLSFEETTNLRMTSRKYRDFITRPSFAKLLEIELSPWAKEKQLYSCYYCARLRQSNKFANRMLQYRKRSHVHPRFCIECGLMVPWSEPGARGYNRGHKLEVGGLEYQVCKNCGLFERYSRKWTLQGKCSGLDHWALCPHGYESKRKNVDRIRDLEKWREEYKKAFEEKGQDPDTWGENSIYRKGQITWHFAKHGLPPSCL